MGVCEIHLRCGFWPVGVLHFVHFGLESWQCNRMLPSDSKCFQAFFTILYFQGHPLTGVAHE